MQAIPSRTILLADDDVPFRTALSAALCARGFAAFGCLDPQTALARSAAHPPARAVIEQRFTDGCGFALLAELHRRLPGLPVVMLTRFPSIAGAARALRMGVRAYLPKPSGAVEVLRAFDSGFEQDKVPELLEPPTHPAVLRWESLNEVFVECNGNLSKTARLLGANRRALRRVLLRGRPEPRVGLGGSGDGEH